MPWIVQAKGGEILDIYPTKYGAERDIRRRNKHDRRNKNYSPDSYRMIKTQD
jgi:hypothetical protein